MDDKKLRMIMTILKVVLVVIGVVACFMVILGPNGNAEVDVREEFEWIKTGIIEGSHLITFFDSAGNYDVTKWMLRLT